MMRLKHELQSVNNKVQLISTKQANQQVPLQPLLHPQSFVPIEKVLSE